MPRIFKGSEITLNLLVNNCVGNSEVSDLEITLYTDNPQDAVVITDRYTINSNTIVVTTQNDTFNGMNDGVINYKIKCYVDGETYTTQRQSNYYLKTPTDFNTIGELEKVIKQNGEYIYNSKSAESWNKVIITVDVPQGRFDTLNSSELTAYTDLLYENSNISDTASSNLETDCSNGETVLDFGKYFKVYYSEGKQWYLEKNSISNSFTELKTSYYIDSLISIRGINCHEIKTVDAKTFKNTPQLRFIGGLIDLGISFINEQVIDLSACEKLYCDDNIGITYEFIDSLYDFTKGENRFGVTTSEIIFNDIDESIKYSLEAKGWKITVK